ncbi:unnamed protein product [Orchesella dallaii]|uniref:Histone-lysine N-methyltransferase eggless n=1 Tax=Orchesella dallaii TaxID=48710 RepID=A0ABP1RHM8_9HEXA
MSLPSTSKSSSVSQSPHPAMECEDHLSGNYSLFLCCGVPGCNEQDILKLHTPPSYVPEYYGFPGNRMEMACFDCILKACKFHNPTTNPVDEREPLVFQHDDNPASTDHSVFDLKSLLESLNPATAANQNDDNEVMRMHEEMGLDDTGVDNVNPHQQYDYVTSGSLDEVLGFVASGQRETTVPVAVRDPILQVFTTSYRQGKLKYEDFSSKQGCSTSSNSQLQSQVSDANDVPLFAKMIAEFPPQVGEVVYAMNDRPFKSWLKAEVIGEEFNPITNKLECVVLCEPTNGCGKPVRLGGKIIATTIQFKGQLPLEHMAYSVPAPHLLSVGTRVIAKFRNDFHTYAKHDGEYFSGIVGEEAKPTTKDRYLIFFDDGCAQYVNPNDVLLLYHHSGLPSRHVHPGHFNFIQMYLKRYPQWPLVRLPLGGLVSAEWNEKWLVTRVLELDCSLAKLEFENYERIEWVYLGSGRIRTIHQNNEEEVASKLADPLQLLEFQGSIKKLSLPSNTPRPKEFIPHKCDSGCGIVQQLPDADFKLMSPLAIPLYYGWDREEENHNCELVVYRTPCGIKLYNFKELKDYLVQAEESRLKLDLFCFESKIKVLEEFVPARGLLQNNDVAKGKEGRPVQVINSIDDDHLPYFQYITKPVIATKYRVKFNGKYDGWSCKCIDNCQNEPNCSCRNSNKDKSPKENVLTCYDNMRLLTAVCGGVFECTFNCQCDKTCPNRVVQCGMKWPLQLFKTAKKGWALRALHDIPQGAFICSYPGEIISDKEADEVANGLYMASLSYELAKESKGKGRKKLSGSSTPHSGKGYTIDAGRMGNVGRFINHSCDPNVFIQRVHFSTTPGSEFPHLAFFAACSIKAGSELSFDYKDNIDYEKCECETPYCKKPLTGFL